jgi:hypothetical protein
MSSVGILAQKLGRYPRAVNQEINNTVGSFGVSLLTSAIDHASGRPGPNVVTGNYVANMRLYIEAFRGQASAWVGNPSPQAHRLEYGFYGTDRAGRVYHQGPFPHMRPALMETWLEYRDQFAQLPVAVWGSM